jgi:predicted alpha-1,6-mannanase (GH76 family)
MSGHRYVAWAGWLAFLSVGSGAAGAADEAYLDQARHAADVLDHTWKVDRAGKLDWQGVHAWQRFEIADALADYTMLSGDRRYLPVVEKAIANRDELNGNDDDLWTLISALKVHAVTGRLALLTDSESRFDRIVAHYWDATCGGGLWWDYARTYKNAITNELLAYAATLLYQATGKTNYLDWSRRALSWLEGSGMINAHDLVNDGLDPRCHNNGGTIYTYNQGVILGALANLYRISGKRAYLDRATALAQASMTALSNHGVLEEADAPVSQDGESFKGIYIRHLGYLYVVMPDGAARRSVAQFLQANAAALAARAARSEGKVDTYWTGSETSYGAAAQASGIDAFNAASMGWKGEGPGAR